MPVQAPAPPAPPAAVAPAAPSSAISTPAAPVKQITPSPTISPTLSPKPPAAGKPVALTALISDAAGKPITGAVVSAEIAMVSMDMGTVHIALKESAPGRYQAAARFTMAGPWRVLLRAKTKDGKALSKTLSVQVGM